MKNLDTPIETALKQLKAGGLVVVMDDEDREAEGDLVGLAEFATPETVNTMVTHARGLLCAPMAPAVATRLGLHPMVAHGTDAFGTAFTVSADATTTSTGISAFDRADTLQQLADPQSQPAAFYHPGHVFPLIAQEHGVLARGGHTEAAVDLARLAGAQPVAYICEVLQKSGKMARRPQLKALAEGMQLPLISIQQIRDYRYRHAIDVVTPIPAVALPTQHGDFQLEAFTTHDGAQPALLLSKGPITPDQPLLLRVHSECLTGDVFGSKRCDCGEQLNMAMDRIQQNGSGAVLYLRQEGRGIGLINKLKAYHLQENGLDTVEANQKLGFQPDERHYGLVAAILHLKHITQVRLLTNNPDKVDQLTNLGLDVLQRVPLETQPLPENRQYLATKKAKFHHQLKEV